MNRPIKTFKFKTMGSILQNDNKQMTKPTNKPQLAWPFLLLYISKKNWAPNFLDKVDINVFLFKNVKFVEKKQYGENYANIQILSLLKILLKFTRKRRAFTC